MVFVCRDTIKGDDMETSDIMVSICCLTYNHEKYIRQALDSFLMQKTNFKYEILIHDDASTDKTADIIREYEEKYPDIIKPIYQTENQFSKRVKISWKYQFSRAKGKYIAMCEGDDFWCDENKLQLQYDELENSKAVFCTHAVSIITESGEKTNKTIPNTAEQCYWSGKELLRDLLTKESYSFQTSSYMFVRESIVEECNALPEFIDMAAVGDLVLMMLLATKGDMCYISREMSCYRRLSASSFTLSCVNDKELRIVRHERNCKAMELFDSYTNYEYHEFVYESIQKRKFILLGLKEQYEEMLAPTYMKFFKQTPIKTQIYILCSAKLPRILKLYQKLKKC